MHFPFKTHKPTSSSPLPEQDPSQVTNFLDDTSETTYVPSQPELTLNLSNDQPNPPIPSLQTLIPQMLLLNLSRMLLLNLS